MRQTPITWEEKRTRQNNWLAKNINKLHRWLPTTYKLHCKTCYTITTNLLRFSNLTISYAQIATKQISATNVRLYKKQSVTWSKQSSAIHHTFFLVKVLRYMHCFLSCNNAYMHCSLLQVQCICFNKQPVQISLRSRQDVCCNCRRLGPNPIDRFRIYFEKF